MKDKSQFKVAKKSPPKKKEERKQVEEVKEPPN